MDQESGGPGFQGEPWSDFARYGWGEGGGLPFSVPGSPAGPLGGFTWVPDRALDQQGRESAPTSPAAPRRRRSRRRARGRCRREIPRSSRGPSGARTTRTACGSAAKPRGARFPPQGGSVEAHGGEEPAAARLPRALEPLPCPGPVEPGAALTAEQAHAVEALLNQEVRASAVVAGRCEVGHPGFLPVRVSPAEEVARTRRNGSGGGKEARRLWKLDLGGRPGVGFRLRGARLHANTETGSELRGDLPVPLPQLVTGAVTAG
jgi:hypothetical protein